MKRTIIPLLLLLPLTGGAAVPKKSASGRAEEILYMPFENQKSILQNEPNRVYRDFVRMAFDKNASMKIRWKALMAAAQMKKKEATPDLVRAANDSTWFMKNAALAALKEVNPEESVRVAKKLLKDKALVVRSAAVEALAVRPEPGVREMLWQELNEKRNYRNKASLWIRPQIVEALAKNPLDEETNLFSKLLKESEPQMQILAVRGLEKLTGMKLGDERTPPQQLVKMWTNYFPN